MDVIDPGERACAASLFVPSNRLPPVQEPFQEVGDQPGHESIPEEPHIAGWPVPPHKIPRVIGCFQRSVA